MTIAIGILATELEQPLTIPNRVVLLADTMGSYNDQYSTDRLHKIFARPEENLYAAAANRIDKASTLLPIIEAHLAKVPKERRTFGDIEQAITMACFIYRRSQFILRVFPKHRIAPNVFDIDTQSGGEELDAKLEKAWKRFNVGCDLIVGAFDKDGQSCLFDINGVDATPEPMNLPGFATIGTGSGNAEFWLAYRKHALSLSVLQATYHAYEAKLMAETSPLVNEHLDLLIAEKGKFWHISTHDEVPGDCPVSFAELKQLFTQYGPKNTGVFRQSAF